MQNKFKSRIKKAQAGMSQIGIDRLSELPNNLKKAAPRIAQIQREKSMTLPGVAPLLPSIAPVVTPKPANEVVQPTYAASQADAYRKKLEDGNNGFDYYKHFVTKGNGDEAVGAIIGKWFRGRKEKKEFKKLEGIDAENRAQAEQRAKMQSAINKGLNVKRANDAAVVTKEFKDKNNKLREVIIGDMNKPAIQNVVNKLDDNGNVPGTNVTPAQTVASKSEPVVTKQDISSANDPLRSIINQNNKQIKKGSDITKKLQNEPKMTTQETAVDKLNQKTKYGFTPAPGYVPNQGVFGRTTPESEAGTRVAIGTAASFAPFGKIAPSIKGLFKSAPAAAKVIKQLPAGNIVKQLPADKPIRVAKDVYQRAAKAGQKAMSTTKTATQPVTKTLPIGKTPPNVYGRPTTKGTNLPNMQPKSISQNASPGSASTVKPPVTTTAAKAISKKSTTVIQNTVSKFRSKIKDARATGNKTVVQKAMKELQDFKNKYPAANKFQSGGSTNMRNNLFNHYYNNL